MGIAVSFLSLGFIARFIVAFVIIAYLYSKNKTDPAIKSGLVLLIALGAVVLLLLVVLTAVLFVTGGIAFLGNAIGSFHYRF